MFVCFDACVRLQASLCTRNNPAERGRVQQIERFQMIGYRTLLRAADRHRQNNDQQVRNQHSMRIVEHVKDKESLYPMKRVVFNKDTLMPRIEQTKRVGLASGAVVDRNMCRCIRYVRRHWAIWYPKPTASKPCHQLGNPNGTPIQCVLTLLADEPKGATNY